MRDIRVSFAKIRRRLGFEPRLSVVAPEIGGRGPGRPW